MTLQDLSHQIQWLFHVETPITKFWIRHWHYSHTLVTFTTVSKDSFSLSATIHKYIHYCLLTLIRFSSDPLNHTCIVDLTVINEHWSFRVRPNRFMRYFIWRTLFIKTTITNSNSQTSFITIKMPMGSSQLWKYCIQVTIFFHDRFGIYYLPHGMNIQMTDSLVTIFINEYFSIIEKLFLTFRPWMTFFGGSAVAVNLLLYAYLP